MAIDFDKPAKTVKPPARLAHVVIRTNRLQEMIEFYKAFTGGYVSFGNEMLSFIAYDEEHHRIGLVQVPGCEDKIVNSCGLEHIAFTFDTLSDLFLSYRQRLEHGIKPFWCIHHGPTVSVYYKDPNGNILETQWDTSSPEEASAFLMSDVMKTNPFGVDFDPEEWIERLQNGAREDDFKPRPASGPRGPETVPAIVGIDQYAEVMKQRGGKLAVAAAA